MRIAMLGPLEVRTDSGEPVALAGARLRTLLVRLALEPGRVVTTRQLVDAVWGEDPPAAAPNALQALVSRLRRVPPGVPIESHPSGYRLAVDADAVDAVRFERLVRAGHAAIATDPDRAGTVLDEALGLWRGPALADVCDADFARGPVARLTELRLSAVEDAAAARLEANGGSEPAGRLVADLDALNREYPTRERLAGMLIRALTTAGRPAEALAAYERTRATIGRELGADPSAELAQLHLAILRDQSTPLGPSTPLDPSTSLGSSTPGATEVPRPAPLTNLRASLTSFVGRDGDVAGVAALLGGARLVTLVGPGGAGKTRLAIESAKALIERYPDGVWLVELAPVTDPAELTTTVLTALGLREQALLSQRKLVTLAADPTERLLRGLRDKRLLLVLDNCEHLIDGAALVADEILGNCSGVTILATSREPLALTGETLWTVESLDLPPVGADSEEAGRFAAVRLFGDRGGAAQPGFRVDDTTVTAVIALCRALDGMPLAIELAAARLRSMTVAQIAARIDDRFRLLVTGSRTAMPRHQTLRAVVDWSWDLLDEAERTLLRRLSVFSGGATLAAAEAVAGLGERTLEVAHALVEKSLLINAPPPRTEGHPPATAPPPGGEVRRPTPTPAMRREIRRRTPTPPPRREIRRRSASDEPRFGMLETIRAYGRERLAEAGEEDAVRASYTTYFVTLAETAEPHLRAKDQVSWLARLAADHDNLHAALRHSIAGADLTTALRLVAATGWYWWLGGHRAEGTDLAAEVLSMVGEADPEVRAAAYAISALNAVDGNCDFDQIHAWISEATRLTRQVDHPRPVLRLVGPLSMLVSPGGEADAADGLATLSDDPDAWTRATGRLMHAHAVMNQGRSHEVAEADLREALRGFTELGERWGLSTTLASLAEQASRAGDHDQAIAWLAEAITHIEALGAPEDAPMFKVRLAHEMWVTGDPHGAAQLLDDADLESERLGIREARAAIRHERAELARHTGRLDVAQRLLAETAEMVVSAHAAPQVKAVVATSLGYLAAARGDLAEARAHHDAALAHALYSVDAPIIGHALVGLAHLAMAEGRAGEAATLLGAATGVRGARDHSLLDLPLVEQAALAALGEDDFAKAHQHGLTYTTVDSVKRLLTKSG